MDSESLMEIGERMGSFETHQQNIEERLKNVESKLDDLLHLKSQGAGALWLVGIIIGSGLLGLLTLVGNFFQGKNHL